MKTKKWIGFDFNSNGWSDSHENRSDAFEQFSRDFKSDLKSMLKDSGWSLDTFRKNHFEVSGFLYNDAMNLWVYFSVSDIRYWQDAWNDNMLVRTADGNKDYQGHRNNYTAFSDVLDYLETL